MEKPSFAEDSKLSYLSPNLAEAVSKLNENADKNDYLFAFFITIMSENGYRVASLYNPITGKWNEERIHIPLLRDYKLPDINAYKIDFILYHTKEVTCSIIAIILGDWMLINLVPKGTTTRCKTRTMSIQVPKYVNLFNRDLGIYWHLKELSMRFKNELFAHVHSEMIMELGVASPCLQGLPQEIKAHIVKNLDRKSRENLENCSTEFS
ncbi:uncharacterized protein LOC106648311 [Trichogramma pretiosum]|uniref:uncharacterized protein LOC106648311 n=1 Tax=Trichogramma pretiosum TaxID=7493 RepID=UPI0006C9DCF5|nr:uncharacterized protein LOC106648311 [Trichogramma pretiosum]XP_014220578.1 uncharacterized protein LOC106648311 [Trichogramma pretiosum]